MYQVKQSNLLANISNIRDGRVELVRLPFEFLTNFSKLDTSLNR